MDLSGLEEKIGQTLHNKELYAQAFTHTSYVHENKGKQVELDNERLEYLGDAVLELIVSEHLYHRFPDMSEGELTRLRSRIVCEPSLAAFAKGLHFGEYVFLGKGEEMAGGRNRPALLADVFEAFIGALFLDQGVEVAKQFLAKIVFPHIDDENWLVQITDAKSMLQEVVQQKGQGTVEYRIVDVKGPAHDRQFDAEVWLLDRRMGHGTGRSKKEAEQAAASMALKQFQTQN
ncbi:ribonuclease III [Mechercharimyces sp. CAU 1602]|uniref:ribonuclease III n=1 Tax=Mechercharimyces sp. CAU 1602 TaxID=2973933 RepID=UPI00216302FF|nr:ribonuclease III [Mechercharimyces sp. CAU 1602]MCS1351361.1 ribonuclease III [Mechercharimyces sp. CAU 1602]